MKKLRLLSAAALTVHDVAAAAGNGHSQGLPMFTTCVPGNSSGIIFNSGNAFRRFGTERRKLTRAEAIVRTEQTASAETVRTEQTASAETVRTEQTVSAETVRTEQTVSAETARAAMTVSAEAARTVIQEPDGRTESRHFLHLAECR